MEWIIRLLGAFYILGGFLLLRTARTEWLLDRAIAQISLQSAPGRWEVLFLLAFGVIYLSAGVALLALSIWGVWLLGAGLVLQAAYYPLSWRLADDTERADRPRWRATRNAGIFSAAAFALSAYAYRLGVLA
ncbi:hypothetical protein [Dichotomicrobium thermohalophilum]|uniref:Uncharacterized protein n=1 Tax=Dichotomicrobium thermohalophilum TaxID=933063 RepID=A0A397PCV4_9HYPH|nr:hypothetical protein [Dichotomicrobium thermohalophilum]RIA47360.1 hypothetical protein BXY53_2438 [Dichotomicrobium thermohalophilum]